MSNIVRVPFYGDNIEALQDGPDVWVSVRRMCANVALTANRQLEKLKRLPWATTTMKVVVADDGKSRELVH